MASKEPCFLTLEPDIHEHQALKAVYEGVADAGQQRLAMSLIVNKFARTHDIPFVPGAQDQSSFLAGRTFVGSRILKYLKLPVNQEEN